MKAALLSLQYKGIKTPWEILADPTQFGWQCRKYLRWKEIQTQAGDRDALKSFSDSLINEVSLDTMLLPTINRIFEMVQRWRKDKDKYSIEPDERENYIDLRRNIALAAKDPAIIPELLSLRLNVSSAELGNSEHVVALFYAAVVAEFLRHFKGGPFTNNKNNETDTKTIPASVTRRLMEVYKDYGLKLERKKEPIDTLRTFLRDIGITAIVGPFQVGKPSVRLSIPAAIVETFDSPESIFVRTNYRQGKLYVAYNMRHPWVKGAGINVDHLEALFQAIGESMLSMIGDKDTLDYFFEHLGTTLARVTMKRNK